RLKERIRTSGNSKPFHCIATSATLASGDHDRAAVADFAQNLFDEDFYPEDVILAEREPLPKSSAGELPYAAYGALAHAITENDPNKIAEVVSTTSGSMAHQQGA